jgi:hypothetical protein
MEVRVVPSVDAKRLFSLPRQSEQDQRYEQERKLFPVLRV